MKIEQNGKTLYHIQSVTDWHDEPYDLFVWAKDEKEISDNLKDLYKNDYENIDVDNTEINDLIDNSNIYIVYAETAKGDKNA